MTNPEMTNSSQPRTPDTFTDWARRQVPHLDVVSSSVPDPVLQEHNLVAIGTEPDRVRETVLAWERIRVADHDVGTVVMGIAPDRPQEIDRPTGADPEGVTTHLATRALQGGLPGAVIFGLLVALVVVVLDGWSTVVIGAALGGAAFGFVAGAVAAYVRGTGWGDAYQNAFVDRDATAAVFVSIHSDDPAAIDEAISAASDDAAVRLLRVERDGSARPITAGDHR